MQHLHMPDADNNPTTGVPWKIYLSRALSTWGDLMWDFGGGIFIMKLSSDSLRLVGI